jgi:hypothetical protein
MKKISTFEEFVNESINEEHASSPKEIADFINKNEKHFAAFFKPRTLSATVEGKTVVVRPGSRSFTITIDFGKSKIFTTGMPHHPESTSYVETLGYIKYATKFDEIETK